MFYSFCQGKHTSLVQWYHELFLGQVKVLEEVGVKALADKGLIKSIAAANGRAGAPMKANCAVAREQMLAIQFICGTNATHKAYLTHLRNSFLDGSDYYDPTSVHEAYNILQRHEPEVGLAVNTEGDGVAFVNAGNKTRNLDHLVCYNCGATGQQLHQVPARTSQLCQHGNKEVANGSGGSGF
jgi:hypothetical protein